MFFISRLTPFFVHKYFRLKKSLKIFINYILGPALFIWLGFSIYHQLNHQKNLHESLHTVQENFSQKDWLIVGAVVILMIVNWGIEALKWQYLMKGIQRVKFTTSLKAVFTGQAFAFNTVNNVGEYLGRVLFLDEGNRLRSISVTIVGSISQILVTLIFGFAGLLFLQSNFLNETKSLTGITNFLMQGFTWLLLLIIVVVAIFYFAIGKVVLLIEKLPVVYRFRYLIQKIEELHPKQLTRILLLSSSRYVVFVTQYLLLLYVFNVKATIFQLSGLICVKFLVLSIIPSIALAELGLRGEVGIQLFGLVSNNTIGILFATTAIWAINKVLPALLGGVFILGVKIFKNK